MGMKKFVAWLKEPVDMAPVWAWLRRSSLWLGIIQFLIGTALPAWGLWLVYVNLNAIWPHTGGVVVGVLLLLYGYIATRPVSGGKRG